MSSELQTKIVSGLERLSEVFRLLYWEKAKNYSLSPIQIQILFFLKDRAPEFRTISYLAMEFGLTKATVSDSVRVLVEKQLVTKKNSIADKRSFELQLSTQGLRMINELADFSKPLEKSLANFSTPDLEQFYAGISEIIFSLNQSGVIQVQRMCFGCRHYQKTEQGHYCKLMEKPLKVAEIRLDCPEFEQKS